MNDIHYLITDADKESISEMFDTYLSLWDISVAHQWENEILIFKYYMLMLTISE